jgi:DNA-binding MarR family transcriptional regulator
MRPWTFVTNHAFVLSSIAHNPIITGCELASEIGITERAIRRIIAELEGAGYITKMREGRRLRYEVKQQAALKTAGQKELTVADLLKVLGNRSEIDNR